jgi:Asp-tRNA(Asn)/Glu-tRNA(Gln) amidotransferase A subunit family amidase
MIIGKLAEECAEQDKIASTQMHFRTIAEASELIRRREISPVELVRECLDIIERLNPTLNAFITVTAESALAKAEQAEKDIHSSHWRGPLHGIPIGLKDLIDTAGVRTTAASAVFKDRVPPEDAEVVRKLKAAGAVLIGKQNLHEFAYGGSSVISHFGPVRNPVNPEFIAGGSSGGAAAAVACGMCYGAIGTDTAGSIREPAALCGVVGLKPSYGLVSTQGIIPLSISLDHAGPITRSVEDAAILLDGLTESKYRESLGTQIGNFVLGIPKKFFFEDLDGEVALAVERAIDQLGTLVSAVREIDLLVSVDRTLQAAESYAYHREMIAASPELYDPETLRRLLSGEGITSQEYESALHDLRKQRREIAQKFQDIDVFVTPTTPIPAPPISALLKDRALLRPAELILLRNTRPVNVWGLPAISVPCGFTSQGLPVGLQIVGAASEEGKVLQVAHAYEKIRDSSSRR